MTTVSLYMAPGTCALVSAIVLEEAGVDFESQLIRFMKGQHKSPDYKKINPSGKVPSLIIEGESLSENVAIITYLNQCFPEADLMPVAEDDLASARQLADLCFCAATLHPIVTRIRMPQFFAAEEAAKSVWEKGCDAMHEYFSMIEDRLSKQAWWYGESWSAMDAYLFWIFWRVEGAKYPVNNFPNYSAHQSRMKQRPAVQRALAREAEAMAQLEAEGLVFTPKPV